MPRYTRRKRVFRRRRFVRRRGGSSSVKRWMGYATAGVTGATALWHAIKSLKSMLNVEYKYIDHTIAGPISLAQYPNGASFADMGASRIVQGDGVSQRNGNQIKLNGIDFRADFDINSSGSNIQRINFIVINYPENENLEPAKPYVWDNISTFDPRRNLSYMKSYHILKKYTVTLDKDNFRHKTLKFSIPAKWHVKYTNAGTNQDYRDVSSGLCQFLCWSDQSANQPTMSNTSIRTRYVDN